MSRRNGLILLVVLNLLALGQVAATYSKLPPRMATHFNAAGKADGWMDRTEFIAFEVSLILLISVIFGGMEQMLRFVPASLINVPNRDYWLTKERESEARSRIGSMFPWFACMTVALIVGIMALTRRANLSSGNLSTAGTWGLLGAYFAGVGIWLFRFFVLFRIPRSDTQGHPR